MDPAFFASAAALRRWFERHHADKNELIIGFYKKGSGRPSVTYSEALDEALCVGWIDGVRRSRDAESYTIRFSPRKPVSYWSAVNRKRATSLKTAGRHAACRSGRLRAEQRRAADEILVREQAEAARSMRWRSAFVRTARAWAFFEAQPPGYRRTAMFYVMSAVRDETKEKRLNRLIEDSEAQRRLGILNQPSKK